MLTTRPLADPEPPQLAEPSVREVFTAALGLGLTSFGGPIAHIGAFRREYVDRRRWLGPRAFGDLVALCQALPGPASSQLGIAIGTSVAGPIGGIAAWLGFTAPSAVLMLGFASVSRSTDITSAGWVHGLELAAVAVVTVAVATLARSQASGPFRATIAVLAATVALLAPLPATDVAVIAGGAAVGLVARPADRAERERPAQDDAGASRAIGSPRLAAGALVLLAGLLLGLPILRALDGQPVALTDTFFRAGSLVFGGGHVVLPLLHAGTVAPGWVTPGDFVAGYGAAQAMPGPLFTFAAYLGAVAGPAPNGIAGGLIALVAIFLPSFLFVFGVLPWWTRLRADARIRGALDGAGAAVVGLLLAALIQPVATTGLRSWADAVVAGIGALLVGSGRVPVIAVVVGLALLGQLAG